MTLFSAAVVRDSPTPIIYSEADWIKQSVRELEVLGRNASQGVKYRASMTMAERGQ